MCAAAEKYHKKDGEFISKIREIQYNRGKQTNITNHKENQGCPFAYWLILKMINHVATLTIVIILVITRPRCKEGNEPSTHFSFK